MKATIDLKSLLAGAIITMLLMLAVGATRESFLRVGRFQVEVDDTHVFVLDSVTGQVWEKYVPAGSGTMSKNFSEPKL